MRKKSYLAMVLGALFLIALIPWFDGLIFKHNYFKLIDLLNQDNRVNIRVLNYSGGWLHSHAKLQVTLINSSLTNIQPIHLTDPITFVVDQNIAHGPILYDEMHTRIILGYANIRSNMIVTDKTNQTNLPVNKTHEGIMQMQLLARIGGRWLGYVRIPAITFALPIGNVNLLGLEGSFRIKVDEDRINRMVFDVKTGTISINSDGKSPYFSQLNIQPIKYRTDSMLDLNGLWSGNSTLYTSGATLVRTDKGRFSADKIVINNKFGISGDTFYETNLAFNIYNFKTPNQALPDVPTLNIYISAHNFSAKGIYEYLNFFREQTAEAIKKVNFDTIAALLLHTITPSSVLKIDINMDTSLGGFTSKSSTSLQNTIKLPKSFSDIFYNSQTNATVTSAPRLLLGVINIIDDYTGQLTVDTKKIPEQAVKPPVSSEDPLVSDNENFNTQIVTLLKEDRLSLDTAMKVVALEKIKLPIALFSNQLDLLKLPTSVASDLKKAYRDHANQNTVVIEKNAKNPDRLLSDQTAQQLIDDLDKVGGIKKDSNQNYTTNLTITDGVWKLNGWIVSSPN